MLSVPPAVQAILQVASSLQSLGEWALPAPVLWVGRCQQLIVPSFYEKATAKQEDHGEIQKCLVKVDYPVVWAAL